MTRTLEIIGAPTSAASYAPGQELAPAALREAGFIRALCDGGAAVIDRGDDFPAWRWSPDPSDPRAQNLAPTVEHIRHVRVRVARALEDGNVPVVLGGNCTVELGTVAAFVDAGRRVGLIYLDLHADMNTPESTKEGALDWMGVGHMLSLEGARDALAGIAPRRPLLDPAAIALFGFEPDNASEFELSAVKRLAVHSVGWRDVAADPSGCAQRLLDGWSRDYDCLLIHFDVDVIDFNDAPLSESTTTRGVGLTLKQATTALRVWLQDPRFAALTVTEINPLHGAEDGSTLRRFVVQLVAALCP